MHDVSASVCLPLVHPAPLSSQVSSINRVLRNLTSDTQKSPLCQSPIYDKFGLLNGQSWPRPSPWYTPGAPMHGIGMTTPYPSQPRSPTHPIPEKKGESMACVCTCMRLCVRVCVIVHERSYSSDAIFCLPRLSEYTCDAIFTRRQWSLKSSLSPP